MSIALRVDEQEKIGCKWWLWCLALSAMTIYCWGQYWLDLRAVLTTLFTFILCYILVLFQGFALIFVYLKNSGLGCLPISAEWGSGVEIRRNFKLHKISAPPGSLTFLMTWLVNISLYLRFATSLHANGMVNNRVERTDKVNQDPIKKHNAML